MIRALATVAALCALVPICAFATEPPPQLAPGEIVSAASQSEWTQIAPEDLLFMDLAADAAGKPRRVVIQLMPAPFSQGWIGNIRRLARAHWWDGLSVNRVQDNYVAQWGDADGEDKAKARALPGGLAVMTEDQYTASGDAPGWQRFKDLTWPRGTVSSYVAFDRGWPVAAEGTPDRVQRWPVHCYGMVGVGRNLAPDTGTGAELYAVIGHAPRHLDRNIALVGRVIDGIENLSSLPRGTGPLGFYETPGERTQILSVRLGNELTAPPAYEYLSTDSASFLRYAQARANRRDAFFVRPAGGADICNIPVPVRRVRTSN